MKLFLTFLLGFVSALLAGIAAHSLLVFSAVSAALGFISFAVSDILEAIAKK